MDCLTSEFLLTTLPISSPQRKFISVLFFALDNL
jgi:hypothetical protein